MVEVFNSINSSYHVIVGLHSLGNFWHHYDQFRLYVMYSLCTTLCSRLLLPLWG
jgi:hypothetical protein